MDSSSSKSRPDSIICCRVSRELKIQITDFREKYHIKTETQAVIELLKIGLFVDAKQQELQNPEIIEFLREHLFSEELVDWIYSLSTDRLEALFGAFRDARDLRYKSKI